MYTEGQKKAKVGIVTVDIHGSSYRLRFSYPKGERHQFTVAKATPEGWTTAIKAAQLINRDVDLGDFDDSYARYSPKHARTLKVAQAKKEKVYNLKELWESYKKQSNNRVAQTTQKNLWTVFDRAIEKCDKSHLSLSSSDKFISFLQENYAVSTIKTLFRTCIDPCVNLAVREAKIPKNPYNTSVLPRMQKKKIQCFEPDEIKAIIEAFHSDRFVSKKARYKDSYYAPMVEFLALTGCRPEEVHALTWEDIKFRDDKAKVIIRKVYSNGVFMRGTKNKVDRIFPCNAQLTALIAKLPRINNEHNLVFPSIKGGYITQRNFRSRYWDKVVSRLVEEGLVSKRIKPYALRHSFITRLIREGVDIATAASLSGNSPKIIMDNYLAARDDFDLPEL